MVNVDHMKEHVAKWIGNWTQDSNIWGSSPSSSQGKTSYSICILPLPTQQHPEFSVGITTLTVRLQQWTT